MTPMFSIKHLLFVIMEDDLSLTIITMLLNLKMNW